MNSPFYIEPLPERDERPATEQGLFRKFDVRRTDGRDAPGGKHQGCEYFVLDVTHDPLAAAALQAYALAAEASHPQLAQDMYQRYDIDRLTPQGHAMSPVAAGGVVALDCGDGTVRLITPPVTCADKRLTTDERLMLKLAADLETCQHQCAAMEANVALMTDAANEARQKLTAAQAEADRLRELLEQTRPALSAWKHEGEQRYVEGDVFHLKLGPNHYRAMDLMDAIDTAVHAAKTEQERGE